MCGIVGILNLQEKPVMLEELRWMCSAIAHRGPDEDGFYLGDGAGLGMRELLCEWNRCTTWWYPITTG